jgi:hypothetical protein
MSAALLVAVSGLLITLARVELATSRAPIRVAGVQRSPRAGDEPGYRQSGISEKTRSP